MANQVSDQKSRLLGIWISIGAEASQVSFDRAFSVSRINDGEASSKSLDAIESHLKDFRGILKEKVDGVAVTDLLGLQNAENVSDQWLLAIALCFNEVFVDVGVSNGLAKQVLCSRICHCLSSKPHDLIWQTKTIIEEMVEKRVLKEDRDGISLALRLHAFVSGSRKKNKSTPSSPNHHNDFTKYLKNLPKQTPREMYEGIRNAGYIGQDDAVRATCVAVYRHFRRLERIYTKGLPINQSGLPPHLLFSGSTGCGKTHVLQTLFRDVLGFDNVAYFDCSSCTQVGILGESVQNSLYQLVSGTSGNALIAQTGVVILDEFDKVCFRQNQERESGRVTSTGVQQALLKMMEECRLDLSSFRQGKSNGSLMFNCGNVMIIALGAFPHHRTKKQSSPMGFNSVHEISKVGKTILNEKSPFPGMMREVYGRFSQVLDFEPLNRESMTSIAKQVLNQIGDELESEGVSLNVEDGVFEFLADQAMKLKTGARGIRRSMNDLIQSALFRAYSSDDESTILNLCHNGSEISCELDSDTTSDDRINLKKSEGVCEALELSHG